MSCKSCQHIRKVGDTHECRFYVPEIDDSVVGKPNRRWPTVYLDDGCGQWLHRLAGMPDILESPDRNLPADGSALRDDGADHAPWGPS